MIVLDTTVLVYAKGATHALRDPCRSLLTAISRGEVEVTTTVEVIQEFVHVRARRRDRQDAVGLGRDYAELLAPLLTISATELSAGLALFERVDDLGAFDAVLAAAAIAADADAVVSADRAFAAVPGLNHVFPDANGVATILPR